MFFYDFLKSLTDAKIDRTGVNVALRATGSKCRWGLNRVRCMTVLMLLGAALASSVWQNVRSVWKVQVLVGFWFSFPHRWQNTFRNWCGTTRNGVRLFSPIPIFSQKLPENGHWEKLTQLIKMIQIQCLSIESTSYPPRQCPQSLRKPPDTVQTPYRQHKIWHILTNPRQLQRTAT